MRTTIRIDDELYRTAKARAASMGTTVAQVIEDALRVALAEPRSRRRTRPSALPVYGGSGTLPGIDLMSNSSLLDAMNGGAAIDALR